MAKIVLTDREKLMRDSAVTFTENSLAEVAELTCGAVKGGYKVGKFLGKLIYNTGKTAVGCFADVSSDKDKEIAELKAKLAKLNSKDSDIVDAEVVS